MNFSSTFRYVMLGLSASAMLLGVAVIAGWLVPARLPGDYRVVMGAVIFLYGAYRFVVTMFDQRRESRGGSL